MRRQPFTTPVSAVPDAPHVRVIAPRPVEVRVDVDAAPVERKFEGIAVERIGAHGAVEIEPETLTIVLTGPPALVDRIVPDQIRLVADVTGLEPRTTAYEVEVAVDFVDVPIEELSRIGDQVNSTAQGPGRHHGGITHTMKRLFGTDGIRAVAGEYPLDPPTVRRFGVALAEVLQSAEDRPSRVVLGRDTRESGPWLRDALAAGMVSHGAIPVDAGVISTPGLASRCSPEGSTPG